MMVKTCPHCGEDSYSSVTIQTTWICPCCESDISEIGSEVAEDQKNRLVRAC
ncbi:hypothetical protein [Microaerobacter geothermalis]|uniref:hypothetical protein n=1 Tax=Microaerobacter geothermalis TaxID=674972 RepID=UPI001F1CDFED|nr:hypothetical protein [Microaerobacter geothermalis]